MQHMICFCFHVEGQGYTSRKITGRHPPYEHTGHLQGPTRDMEDEVSGGLVDREGQMTGTARGWERSELKIRTKWRKDKDGSRLVG